MRARIEREGAAVEWLSRHPLIVQATRYGRAFRLDPVDVLRDGGDEFIDRIRSAVMAALNRDQEAEAAEARKNAPRKR